MARNLSKYRKTEILAKIKSFLEDGVSQRDMAHVLGISTVTVNRYCQELVKRKEELEAQREEVQQQEERIAIPELSEAAKKEIAEIKKDVGPITQEKLDDKGLEVQFDIMLLFQAYVVELKARIPRMKNDQLAKDLLQVWAKINESNNGGGVNNGV